MDSRSYHVRVSKRWVRIAMIVGVTALIVAPLTAVANHVFNDVPDSHTFHNDITWLADTGVTRGCNPPANDEYCPDDNVTRGQMAAFLRRLSEGEIVDAATAATADDAAMFDGMSPTEYQHTWVHRPGGIQEVTANADGWDELETVTIEVPEDGVLTVDYFAAGFGSSSDENIFFYVVVDLEGFPATPEELLNHLVLSARNPNLEGNVPTEYPHRIAAGSHEVRILVEGPQNETFDVGFQSLVASYTSGVTGTWNEAYFPASATNASDLDPLGRE